jgi:hypothetical protein
MKFVREFIRGPRNRTPLLLPHLFKRIRYVKRADFFAVLEFQKLVAAVACHIDKYVRPVICEQALGPRHGGLNATFSCMGQEKKKSKKGREKSEK